MEIEQALMRARALTAAAEDAAAKQAYVDILRRDPTNFQALNELGNLALAGGFRSAARTAYLQAVTHHPGNAVVRINLANVLREESDRAAATLHYQAALAIDPELHEAHQGMAWALQESDPDAAERHWRKGFSGRAVVAKPYRGKATGVALVMLVSARGGNIPTQLWIDDRRFSVTAIYTEFFDPGTPLPPHSLVVNAIGDADLCGLALARAEAIAAQTNAPIINAPARVKLTGRAQNARRLAAIPGVIAPRIDEVSPAALLAARDLSFPLLLRRPGFHTGEHFLYLDGRDALAAAVAALSGETLLAISYLDARGADGLSRKYRVMFIDGVLYPLHLALSSDWKVHYFTSDMARSAALRAEERRFLEDMPSVLGAHAMAALRLICEALGLEYAGIDFALAPDGSVLFFEANASMVVFPPGPDPLWDYRRGAIAAVLQAATRMLLTRARDGACRPLTHRSSSA